MSNPPSNVLFIGNLPANVDKRLIYELGVQAGPVARVTVPPGENGTANKGFAFVEYNDLETATYAIKLFEGLVRMQGRTLRVAYGKASAKGMAGVPELTPATAAAKKAAEAQAAKLGERYGGDGGRGTPAAEPPAPAWQQQPEATPDYYGGAAGYSPAGTAAPRPQEQHPAGSPPVWNSGGPAGYYQPVQQQPLAQQYATPPPQQQYVPPPPPPQQQYMAPAPPQQQYMQPPPPQQYTYPPPPPQHQQWGPY